MSEENEDKHDNLCQEVPDVYSGENKDNYLNQEVSDVFSQSASHHNTDQMEKTETFFLVKNNLDVLCSNIDITKEEALCIKVSLPESRCDIGGSQMGNKFLELHSELVQKFYSFCNDSYKGLQADRVKQDVEVDSICQDLSTEVANPVILEGNAGKSSIKLFESCETTEERGNKSASSNAENKIESSTKERKRKSELKLSGDTNSVKKIKMTNVEKNSEERLPSVQRKSRRSNTCTNILVKAALRKASLNDTINTNLSKKGGKRTDSANFNSNAKSKKIENKEKPKVEADTSLSEAVKQYLDDNDEDVEDYIKQEEISESEDDMYTVNEDLSSEENEDIQNDFKKKAKTKKKNKIQCTECDKSFSKKEYPKHLRNFHKKLNAFKCEICHNNFNSLMGLNRHIKNLKCKGSKDEKNVLTSVQVQPLNASGSSTDTFNDHENVISSDNNNSNEGADSIVLTENPDPTKEKKDFTCHLCLKHMRTEEGLANHLLHHEQNKNQCRICDKYFVNYYRLKTHELTHNPEKHVCNVCSMEFTQGRYLVYHMKGKHGDTRSACYNCGILFDCVVERNKHMLTHLSQHCSNFVCSKCGKTFELMRYLKTHNKTCHNGTEEVCKICSEFFDTKAELRKHMWEHRSDFSYICSICKQSFETTEMLTSHLKAEHNSHMYVCESCGQEFNSSREFKKHLAFEHHQDSLFSCEICDSKFMDAKGLKDHIGGVHDTARPFQCDECGMCFKTRGTMKSHILRHNSDNMKQCEFCSAKFRSYEGLNNHFLDHHSDQINLKQLNFRVYECEYCKKRFSQKAIYIRHLRTHTGERPYKCELCDQTFPIPAKLNKHMKRHENRTKNFSCDTCGVKYFESSHLNRHYKSRAHQEKCNNLVYLDEIPLEGGASEVKVEPEDMKIVRLDQNKISINSENNEHVYTIEDSSLLNFPESTIYVIAEADGSEIEYVQLQSEHVDSLQVQTEHEDAVQVQTEHVDAVQHILENTS